MPYAHIFSSIATNIETILSQSGYIILFIVTIAEGIPVVGMAIPGNITIVMAGFLSKLGTLNIYWVIFIASIGAVLGDYIGFFIGKRYGMTFIDRLRPYFFVTDAHIERAQDLLSKHTGKAMIIGRFIPATRALLPFLVGSNGTSSQKFWFFNIVGGLSWVISSVFVGYIFGAGYHAVAGHLGRYILGAIILAVIIIWGYRFVNMRFPIFRRYELFTLLLNIFSLWAFAGMIDVLSDYSFKLGFDMWVNESMALLYATFPFVSKIAWWITNIGDTEVIGILGLIVSLYFIFQKRWRSAVIMILSVGTTAVALGFFKEFFHIARPANALLTIVNDFSFPSGHAGMASAFFVALAYLLAPRIHSWVKRELMLAGCIMAIIAIGLSRLVLNVHWASDVVAGWALGAFLATASILLVRYVGTIFMIKYRHV